jgi:hypothetical protein
VFTDGIDAFIPLDAVADVWETSTKSVRVADSEGSTGAPNTCQFAGGVRGQGDRCHPSGVRGLLHHERNVHDELSDGGPDGSARRLDHGVTLLNALRKHLGLTGTKMGCGV